MAYADIQDRLKTAYEKKLQEWGAQTHAYNLWNRPDIAGLYASSSQAMVDRWGEVTDLAKRADLGEEQWNTIWNALSNEDQNSALHLQGLREYAVAGDKRKEARTQLQDFRNRAETQIFGAPGADLASALANPQGELGALSQFLASQQSDVFRQNLAPLIQQKLGGQGLIDSGANVELQSKALGDLERSRQSQLMNAALGAKDQIRGLERSDILGDIGSQQQALSNLSDIQRTGITMSFQRELESRRESLARELASISSSGPSLMNQILGGVGMAGGAGMMAMGNPMGLMPALAGAGMAFGGTQGGQAGASIGGMLGSGFYANRSFPRTGYSSGGKMRWDSPYGDPNIPDWYYSR